MSKKSSYYGEYSLCVLVYPLAIFIGTELKKKELNKFRGFRMIYAFNTNGVL